MIQVRQRAIPEGIPKACDYQNRYLLPGDICYYSASARGANIYAIFIIEIIDNKTNNWWSSNATLKCLAIHPHYLAQIFRGNLDLSIKLKQLFIRKSINSNRTMYITDKYKDLGPQEALVKYYSDL